MRGSRGAPRSSKDFRRSSTPAGASSVATKELAIPSHVNPGLLIGPGGNHIREFARAHGVTCYVDSDNGMVVLRGHPDVVAFAERSLWILFYKIGRDTAVHRGVNEGEHYEKRTFEVLVCDGPSFDWQFREVRQRHADPNVCGWSFRLERSRTVELAGEYERRDAAWVNALPRSAVDLQIMPRLTEQSAKWPTSVKIAFGEMCFSLKGSVRLATDMPWSQLQDLKIPRDVGSRWTNMCNLAIPRMQRLLESIQVQADSTVARHGVIQVDVMSSVKNIWCSLKFHFVDGSWEARHEQHDKRVRATADILLEDGLSFRVRAACRSDHLVNDYGAVEDLVYPTVPSGGDIYDAQVDVVKNEQFPDLAASVTKRSDSMEVEMDGVRFKIGYLNRGRTIVKLTCRLAPNAKEELAPEENEQDVLARKVLRMINNA